MLLLVTCRARSRRVSSWPSARSHHHRPLHYLQALRRRRTPFRPWRLSCPIRTTCHRKTPWRGDHVLPVWGRRWGVEDKRIFIRKSLFWLFMFECLYQSNDVIFLDVESLNVALLINTQYLPPYMWCCSRGHETSACDCRILPRTSSPFCLRNPCTLEKLNSIIEHITKLQSYLQITKSAPLSIGSANRNEYVQVIDHNTYAYDHNIEGTPPSLLRHGRFALIHQTPSPMTARCRQHSQSTASLNASTAQIGEMNRLKQ